MLAAGFSDSESEVKAFSNAVAFDDEAFDDEAFGCAKTTPEELSE